MTVTTLPIQDFIQNAAEATSVANNEPVFITDRGRTTHVLLKFSDYQRLIREHRNMAELLAVPDMADIEFEPIRSRETAKPADFS
ncbi:PHD/YefM family antitoxin component YafN of YafNO toxin-antitoxin module [Duganella sp. 1411]|uniref:type II toxin-antitoxin system Phd/YefM family antitoxin n=1 Tax=Duganella sp. 1411 TaxID=2806572 RepID=UPI001AE1B556|nr:type II toxin-antitoxin system Phd/YefM family antitoxin [Duganella sp. 1411]MBP1204330.1 PHD/YefM family antitoxin component YafN of YafNO toxin-antitoxin module [Duganella sp. 1411]